ncbi:MAG TPA: TrmH family RNA methyltransferase, partial [Chitinophagales bacterium]|nr:TrmH family RNA methyltransferase [Chitinophagales bacterium]
MTPAREQKIADVLLRRQLDLTVVLENVHDPHNISAVLRSCDAVGVQEIFALNKNVPKPKRLGRKSSSGSVRWVDVHYFMDVEKCMAAVKNKYQKIYALSSDHAGKNLHDADLTGSVALLFGNEKDGLTKEIMQYA